MDPFRFTVAIVPLAVYLLTMGLLNLRPFPFVTTGARDIGTLGIGIVGLVIIGPLELFFPEAAAIRFGAYVWILLIVFYGLCVSLVVLLMRPRIVIYNTTIDQVRPLLTDIAKKMDTKSRWTSDSMIIPNRKIHFHLEAVDWLGNVQIISTGNRQSFEGWRELETSLREATRTTRVPPGVIGVILVTVAGLLALTSASWMVMDQTTVAEAFREFIRF
ncbi:MAG: hypothetical protein R3C03_10055 [Pirellulaceae bacterium]